MRKSWKGFNEKRDVSIHLEKILNESFIYLTSFCRGGSVWLRREPGKLVGFRPLGSSNLPLGVILLKEFINSFDKNYIHIYFLKYFKLSPKRALILKTRLKIKNICWLIGKKVYYTYYKNCKNVKNSSELLL